MPELTPEEMARRVMAARASRADVPVFTPAMEWGAGVGKSVGDGAHGLISEATRAKGRDLVARTAAFMRGDGRDNKPVAIVQEYNAHAYPNAAKDAEIAENARLIEETQRRLQPVDGGEIDDTRQPVSFQREFSTKEEADAERVKRAIASAQAK